MMCKCNVGPKKLLQVFHVPGVHHVFVSDLSQICFII